MIITFADTSGALDGCASAVPVAHGFADPVIKGTAIPGVNNFRAFVLGTGPDRRDGGPVFGSTANTQKITFQVDYTTYSGITVDPEGKVYVISGGTPAGVGLNPSPSLGEILVFPDDRPYDLRADYLDLRGNTPPNSGSSGGNVGNGVANRFDYIYRQAPLDPVTNAPTGVAGLSHGFLLYLNRTRTPDNTVFELFNTGTPAAPAFDLRFEGANRALSTPVGQKDKNRGLVRWFGVDCKSARTFTCPGSSAPW